MLNSKKINLDERILVAGAYGMAGKAIIQILKKAGYGEANNGGKLLTPTREEVDFLAMHKKNVTFETTPQHLTMYAPDCYDKLGTYAQMNPPLRTKEHYDRLWVAIKNNIVDVLGSDHAPHLKENKDKE